MHTWFKSFSFILVDLVKYVDLQGAEVPWKEFVANGSTLFSLISFQSVRFFFLYLKPCFDSKHKTSYSIYLFIKAVVKQALFQNSDYTGNYLSLLFVVVEAVHSKMLALEDRPNEVHR